ncbi:hypothetical protein NQ318_010478 [Aromia moschata]|uniref:Mos1 transposase HTH domain-containing protein n=1 Tax=Aromia moschata TaxID=1265417 RepID=A0AAV8YCI6_9CUCU|nr:hypothetical protein NQ318_010478 [Aromia moschata]
MQRSLEQRMAIKFCVKLEKSAAETIPMLKKAFGVDCLSDRQIFRRHKAFAEGREDVNDGQQPPVPTTIKCHGELRRRRMWLADMCILRTLFGASPSLTTAGRGGGGIQSRHREILSSFILINAPNLCATSGKRYNSGGPPETPAIKGKGSRRKNMQFYVYKNDLNLEMTLRDMVKVKFEVING